MVSSPKVTSFRYDATVRDQCCFKYLRFWCTSICLIVMFIACISLMPAILETESSSRAREQYSARVESKPQVNVDGGTLDAFNNGEIFEEGKEPLREADRQTPKQQDVDYPREEITRMEKIDEDARSKFSVFKPDMTRYEDQGNDGDIYDEETAKKTAKPETAPKSTTKQEPAALAEPVHAHKNDKDDYKEDEYVDDMHHRGHDHAKDDMDNAEEDDEYYEEDEHEHHDHHHDNAEEDEEFEDEPVETVKEQVPTPKVVSAGKKVKKVEKKTKTAPKTTEKVVAKPVAVKTSGEKKTSPKTTTMDPVAERIMRERQQQLKKPKTEDAVAEDEEEEDEEYADPDYKEKTTKEDDPKKQPKSPTAEVTEKDVKQLAPPSEKKAGSATKKTTTSSKTTISDVTAKKVSKMLKTKKTKKASKAKKPSKKQSKIGETLEAVREEAEKRGEEIVDLQVEADHETAAKDLVKFFGRKLDVRQHSELVQTIEACHRFLQQAGVTFFLHGRSLLGHYRHAGGLIPWDDRAEIAVMPTDPELASSADLYLERLQQQMELFADYALEKADAKSLSFRKGPRDLTPFTWAPTVRIVIMKVISTKTKKPLTDFINNPPAPQTAYVRFEGGEVPIPYWFEDIMPLKPGFFENIETKIPSNSKAVLKTEYGNIGICETTLSEDEAKLKKHDVVVTVNCADLAHIFTFSNIAEPKAVAKAPKIVDDE